MAPSRWDRRRGSPSTCPAPPAPRPCSSAAPPPVLRIPRPPFPGCLARVTSATRSPPPPLHPRCLPGAGVPRAPRSGHGHGFGLTDAAAAAAAVAAASTCHPRSARPRPLRPAARGYAELPAAVPRPLSWSAALAGEALAATARGAAISPVGEGLGMRFPPLRARDRGSSEREGVGNGGSTMEVGPSGEGGTGVLSIEVGGPSEGDGGCSSRGGRTGGGSLCPSDGGGFGDANPSDECGVGGGPSKEGKERGSSLLRPPRRLWLCTAAQRPSGRPSPTSLRSDNPFLLLLPLLLFLFSSSSSSSFPQPLPYPPQERATSPHSHPHPPAGSPFSQARRDDKPPPLTSSLLPQA